jgi:hypothetical protein
MQSGPLAREPAPQPDFVIAGHDEPVATALLRAGLKKMPPLVQIRGYLAGDRGKRGRPQPGGVPVSAGICASFRSADRAVGEADRAGSGPRTRPSRHEGHSTLAAPAQIDLTAPCQAHCCAH